MYEYVVSVECNIFLHKNEYFSFSETTNMDLGQMNVVKLIFSMERHY